jgi:hypothetical protein
MLTIYRASAGTPVYYLNNDLADPVGVFDIRSYAPVGYFADRVFHSLDGRALLTLNEDPSDNYLHPVNVSEPSTLYFDPLQQDEINRLRGAPEEPIPYGSRPADIGHLIALRGRRRTLGTGYWEPVKYPPIQPRRPASPVRRAVRTVVNWLWRR